MVTSRARMVHRSLRPSVWNNESGWSAERGGALNAYGQMRKADEPDHILNTTSATPRWSPVFGRTATWAASLRGVAFWCAEGSCVLVGSGRLGGDRSSVFGLGFLPRRWTFINVYDPGDHNVNADDY